MHSLFQGTRTRNTPWETVGKKEGKKNPRKGMCSCRESHPMAAGLNFQEKSGGKGKNPSYNNKGRGGGEKREERETRNRLYGQNPGV